MKYAREKLLALHRTMLRIRECEESFVDPIINGEIRCPAHLCTGQEAVSAGLGAALTEKDYVFGNHRSHGHYLAKGGDMKKLVAEMYGKETGCSRGRGGSMHLIDTDVGMLGSAPIVAGTISLALGAALASSIRKDNRVTVSFFGDGATGEGVLCESLNYAALKNLPIIFACENNFYSTHLPIEEIRVSSKIFDMAKPFGVKSFMIDGNDVMQVHEHALKAVEYCRNGDGPVFLEFLTYRMRGHVGPDDNIQGCHTDIRPESEIEEWRGKDPVDNFEKHLLQSQTVTEEELRKIKVQVEKEVSDAHDFAHKSPYPDPEELSDYVFSS